MSGNGVGIVGIRRMLDRAEILHTFVIRNHHQAAGVLTGGTPGPHTAQGQAVLLGPAGGDPILLQVLLHESIGGLLRQGPDGTGPKHLGLAKHLNGVPVGLGLIFT